MSAPVLIMAGGRGLRLHPLTLKTPKPLLKVGSKPILRTIVDSFVAQGFHNIWLALNYKAELIREYFGDGEKIGCSISYIIEDEPLGTAGALRLLPPHYERVIVSNADVLTQIDYRDMLAQHERSGCIATVATALHQQQVHFGVVDTSGGRMLAIREKPIESFQVNSGIYVIDRAALGYAPPSGPLLMTDLLAALPAASVAVYEIESYWLDLGRFEDLGRALAYAE